MQTGINRNKYTSCIMKSSKPPKKAKNPPRPSSVNFCQNFCNLSHETVPLNGQLVDFDICSVRTAGRRWSWPGTRAASWPTSSWTTTVTWVSLIVRFGKLFYLRFVYQFYRSSSFLMSAVEPVC